MANSALTGSPSPLLHSTVSWEPKVAKIIRDRIRERDAQTTMMDHPTTDTLSSSVESDDARPIAMTTQTDIPPLLVVGLIGIPGSGKSTSALILSALLDSNQEEDEGESSIGNVIVPMDGYHYPLATLRSFPNADEVIYRRGAPDTFDSKSLRNDLQRIKQQDDIMEVTMPGFNHAKGDPEPGAHTFLRNEHSVVICEGLYLLHDSDGWDGMEDLFDFTVFLDSDIDDCIARLKERNKCIPGYTAEEIAIRCDAVDRVNAQTVLRSKIKADLVVNSVGS